MNYKISVIIPIHNNEKHLNNAIDSVIHQTIGFENIELILIDDVSTDSSLDIINHYSQYDNCKAIFLKENLRPGFARNVGIKNSSGEYLMFLDADDEYSLDVCETLYNMIKDKEEVDVIYSNHIVKTRGKEFIGLVRDEALEKVCPNGSLKDFTYNFPIWGAIYNSEFIKKNDIKCSKNMEDVYFNVFVFLNAKCIICLNDYFGYKYNVFDFDNNQTITNTHDKDTFINYYLNGATEIVKKINKEYSGNLKYIGNEFIRILLMFFLQCRMDFSDRLELIKKIYDFEQLYDYEIKLEVKWASILNYFILNKHFYIASTISTIINFILTVNFIEKLARKTFLKQIEYNNLKEN